MKLKNTKVLNMIVLGAFLDRTKVLEMPAILKALRKVLPERYHHLLPVNEQALQRGRELASEPVLA